MPRCSATATVRLGHGSVGVRGKPLAGEGHGTAARPSGGTHLRGLGEERNRNAAALVAGGPLFVCTPLGTRNVCSQSLSRRRRRPEYPTYWKARAAFSKHVGVAARAARRQQHCFTTTTPTLASLSAGSTLARSPTPGAAPTKRF